MRYLTFFMGFMHTSPNPILNGNGMKYEAQENHSRVARLVAEKQKCRQNGN